MTALNVVLALPSNASVVGGIDAIEGNVEIRKGNGLAWQEVLQSESIQSRDKLRTKMDSYIRFSIASSCQVEMKDNTVLDIIRLSDDKKPENLKLWAGTIRLKDLNASSNFELWTPLLRVKPKNAIVGVMISREMSTLIWVEKGTIEVSFTEDNTIRHLSSGEKVLFNHDNNNIVVGNMNADDKYLTQGWDRTSSSDTHNQDNHSDITHQDYNIEVGEFHYGIVGQTIVIREEPTESLVTLETCPGKLHLRVNVQFPRLMLSASFRIQTPHHSDVLHDLKLSYRLNNFTNVIYVPENGSCVIKDVDIEEPGKIDFVLTNHEGTVVSELSRKINAEKRVSVNGKLLSASSEDVFEDDIPLASDGTLEIEAYWMVDGQKMETYFDRTTIVRCP